jgi:hypothetical protein
LCIIPVLEADDVVVDEAHDDHITARVPPAPLVGPDVEDIVETGRRAPWPKVRPVGTRRTLVTRYDLRFLSARRVLAGAVVAAVLAQCHPSSGTAW